MNSLYKEQVRLLLRTLPVIYQEDNFAVHGGTAINLSSTTSQGTRLMLI